MSGLLSSLTDASAALNVFSRALGTSQANVANASTPGYAAQRASILTIGGNDPAAIASDFISISSNSNAFADASVRASSSQASNTQTTAQQLSSINQLFDITGSSGILAAFQQFSAAFSALSVTPNDSTLQANALNAAGSVASSFQSVAASLDSQRSQVDSSLTGVAGQINSLAKSIQQLNIAAVSGSGATPSADASLRSDLDQLSSLVDISVTKNGDGSVSVLAGGQLPLVEGAQAFKLSVNPSAATGSQVTSSGGGGSPAAFSGQLGALLDTRNNDIGSLLGSSGTPGTLNSLAAGFASRVNSLLTSGVTSDGTAGVPVFSYDSANLSNAARTLSLNSSVTPAQLALGTAGTSAQANGIANQLAALPSSTAIANQISGLSPEGLFGSIAASVGQKLSDAQSAATGDQTSLTEAQANRQQAIGVSLDTEATNITEYQRAYQANAQVVSILNQLTDTTINLISGASGVL